jgi:phosphoesterase RecJ-like protein
MSIDLIQKVISKIKNPKINSIAIVMHDKPDGDCIGSAVALESALKLFGKKNVDLIIHDKVNSKFSSIVGEDRVERYFYPPDGKKYDLLFMVDFSNPNRTIYNVKRLSKYIIVLDHHIYNNPFGDMYVCQNTSATGIIVYNIVKKLVPITPLIATSLYLSIRSDTSSFKNPNTDDVSHYVAGKLISLGASIETINNIYDTKSKEFVVLLGKTMQFVQYDEKYNIGYLIVHRKTIKSSKVADEEVNLLIDQIRGISGVDVAYLFVEGISNIRISARSKNTPVNKILAYFGGGGHPKASGCAIDGADMIDVVNSVLDKTREYIDSLKQ